MSKDHTKEPAAGGQDLAGKISELGDANKELLGKIRDFEEGFSEKGAGRLSSLVQNFREEINSALALKDSFETDLQEQPVVIVQPGAVEQPPAPTEEHSVVLEEPLDAEEFLVKPDSGPAPAPTPAPAPEPKPEPVPEPRIIPPRRSPIVKIGLSKKILLIENNAEELETISGILEDAGFEIDVATTGREGLKKAAYVQPDLILLDMQLPDISGFELCSLIKREPRLEMTDTKVIVLSDGNNLDDITTAFAAGADDYIIKLPQVVFLMKKLKAHLKII